jgi:ATP-dependent DNA helicase RecG
VFKQIREDRAPQPDAAAGAGRRRFRQDRGRRAGGDAGGGAGQAGRVGAPTELLAEQHLNNLRGWLEPLGVRIAWLAGKVTGKRAPR